MAIVICLLAACENQAAPTEILQRYGHVQELENIPVLVEVKLLDFDANVDLKQQSHHVEKEGKHLLVIVT